MFICKYLRSLKRRINVGFLICFSILLIIIASLTPVYIGKQSKYTFLVRKTSLAAPSFNFWIGMR